MMIAHLMSEGGIVESCTRRRQSPSVSNFIQKTYNILQDKKYEAIMSWAEPRLSGKVSSFQIHNVKEFEMIVLPQYFKHSNLSSFVRQLNMYNFHKVRGDKNEYEFEHEKFRKDAPGLLCQIRRKQTDSSSQIPSQLAISNPDIAYAENEANLFWNSLKNKYDPKSLIADPCPPEQVSEAEVQIAKDIAGSQLSVSQMHSLLAPERNLPEQQQEREDRYQKKYLQLQEINRNLRKIKQTKLIQMNSLTQQSKGLIAAKFSKILISLIASKIKEETHGFPQIEYLTLPRHNRKMSMNDLIEHILNHMDCLSFVEYSDSTDGLFADHQNA